ncbi:MAG: hypothetical protein J2P21_00080 [Chloracidobacterium sp.]|nr:hypothetical protein [Chloracidobacterium sp.]
MRTLSAELLSLTVVFEPLFTKLTWERAKLPLLGAPLQRGKRAVTARLRVVGPSQEGRFQNYPRALNRASRSAIAAAGILLGLIILTFPPDGTIVFAADTIERRCGKKVSKLGCHRDPVRSTRKQTIKCLGLKSLSTAILVKPPWCSQVYALRILMELCSPQPEGQPSKVFHHHIRRKARSSKKKFVATRRNTARQESEIDWRGGRRKKMLILTRTAVLRRLGHAQLWIRHAITRDPEGKLRDEVFACAAINTTHNDCLLAGSSN